MVFTVFQVVISITEMVASFRCGVAITVVSLYFHVMPDPRCGMPASSRSATF